MGEGQHHQKFHQYITAILTLDERLTIILLGEDTRESRKASGRRVTTRFVGTTGARVGGERRISAWRLTAVRVAPAVHRGQPGFCAGC